VFVYRQIAIEYTVLRLTWGAPGGATLRGSLWVMDVGLDTLFVCRRYKFAEPAVVAALSPKSDSSLVAPCVGSLLAHGAEWYGHELFDELPAHTVNACAEFLPRNVLREGYCDFARRVLGETEPELTHAHFDASYEEEPGLPLPAS
jgi:hypothetical protein